MQVAVVGGGIVGVATAYFLGQAGHEVVVIERHTNVAESASFGSSGVLSAVDALPWATSGMSRRLLASLLQEHAGVRFDIRATWQFLRWTRRGRHHDEALRIMQNRSHSLRLGNYGQEVLQALAQELPIDFERSRGYLQLFRTEREQSRSLALQTFLAESELPHEVLTAPQARLVEPALNPAAALTGALHLPQDGAGNCPLFCKHLRNAAQALGVTFHFGSVLDGIETLPGRAAGLMLRIGANRFPVDAVVLAAGAGSAALLRPLGIDLPLYPVRTYAATAAIRNFDDAPLGALADPLYQVAIARLGLRMRVAGIADFSQRPERMRNAAIGTLIKVASDWFPNAAHYNTATFWSGIRPTLPDALPVIGPTPIPGLFLNLGQAGTGWAMALGSARVVADQVSGRSADIDTEGFTMARYA